MVIRGLVLPGAEVHIDSSSLVKVEFMLSESQQLQLLLEWLLCLFSLDRLPDWLMKPIHQLVLEFLLHPPPIFHEMDILQ